MQYVDFGLNGILLIVKEYMRVTGCEFNDEIDMPPVLSCTFEQAWSKGLFSSAGISLEEGKRRWEDEIGWYCHINHTIFIKGNTCPLTLLVHETVHALQNIDKLSFLQREAEAYTIADLYRVQGLEQFKREMERRDMVAYDLLMDRWNKFVKPTLDSYRDTPDLGKPIVNNSNPILLTHFNNPLIA